jgi:hypothetical protein
MRNKLKLSELRNVIKEEIQFQLTKKQLFENLDKKTLKRILNEDARSTITYIKKINASTADKFRIVNPNPNDKITTIVSKDLKHKEQTFMEVKFTYTLMTSGGSAEYQAFSDAFNSVKNNNANPFFSFDNSSLIILNHNDTIKNAMNNTKLSYFLELQIVHSPNITFNLNEFKGQKVTP